MRFGILLFCLFSQQTLFPIGAQAAVVRALLDDWLVYHPVGKNYLPYDYQIDRNTLTVSTWINPRSDNYYLELSQPVGTCVYFNGHLWYKVAKPGTVHILLQDVFAQESPSHIPVFLTIFSPNGNISVDKMGIVNEPKPTLTTKAMVYAQGSTSTPDQKPIVLPKLPLRNESALLLLLIIFLYGIIKQFDPREFTQLLSVADLVRNPLEGYGGAARKIWTSTNIFMMIANCLAITYVFSLSDRYETAIRYVQDFFADYQLLPLAWLVPMLFFLAGCAYYLLKFVLVEFASTIFQASRVSTIHFYEFLRLSSFLSISLLVLVVLVYNTFFLSLSVLWVGLVVLVALMQGLRLLKVALVAMRMASFRLLYLIAYLCITEIVPMVLMLRILMPTA